MVKIQNILRLLLFVAALGTFGLAARALPVGEANEDEMPKVTAFITYYDKENEEMIDNEEMEDGSKYSGGAPLEVHLRAEVENAGDKDVHYEWRIEKDAGGAKNTVLVRYDAEIDYSFVESGTFYVTCQISLLASNGDIEEMDPIGCTVGIENSKLEVPNAFTPNGDGINDIFKVKDGCTSIVDFHAAVFTRSGKLIYQWDDVKSGWDGTMNGNGGADAPDGAYYFVMRARGADGLKYDRKMVINLLRKYNEAAAGAN